MASALAITFAESISMGAMAYTSRLAERDHYLSERQRELDEIHHFRTKNLTKYARSIAPGASRIRFSTRS
jgi:hypothetical protein